MSRHTDWGTKSSDPILLFVFLAAELVALDLAPDSGPIGSARGNCGKVDELLYPAPSRWDPQSSPAGEHPEEQSSIALIIFNRPQFDAAVRQLKSSPPPEMTTPFLGADSR